MKKFFSEFKAFISRGNVIDLAVGVIIGSAFTAIVNSLVKDMVMPFVGWLFGGINFTDLKIVVAEATETTPEAAVYYGNFIQNVVNFILIAFVVFIFVKIINALRNAKKKEEEAKPAEPPKPSEEVLLLTEIRDLLKK